MLRLRLSVDLKCPRHPGRQYPSLDLRCARCASLSIMAESARQVEQQISLEVRYGAEVRWKVSRRRPRPPSPGPATPPE
jgi:hypothetical protein